MKILGISGSPVKRGTYYLLEKTLAWVRETGYQVKLEVHASNKAAINLYKKYGFKYLGDYRIYIIRDINYT